MKASIQAAVEQELHDDEHVEWLGAPIPRMQAIGGLGYSAFAVIWLAMALFIFGAWHETGSVTACLLVAELGFLGVGLFMLLTPVIRYVGARRTAYVITNQRAFELTSGRWQSIRSYMPADIGQIQRRERRNGSGHLYFATKIHHRRRSKRDPHARTWTEDIGFTGIADVKAAEAHIIRLKAAHRSPAPESSS